MARGRGRAVQGLRDAEGLTPERTPGKAKPPGTSVPAAFLRLAPLHGRGGIGRLRAADGLAVPAARPGMQQGRGGPSDARAGHPLGPDPCPNDGDLDPARAVVTPPHLLPKMNAFYALMRPTLAAAWRGPRGDRRAASSTHFYAFGLCSLGISRSRASRSGDQLDETRNHVTATRGAVAAPCDRYAVVRHRWGTTLDDAGRYLRMLWARHAIALERDEAASKRIVVVPVSILQP